ncbi:MAG: nucleotidyltransferase family protein [Rhodospirillales bacterium]|nr:nucleotidyltransferase family protein [Rhodospirillales bacterium]
MRNLDAILDDLRRLKPQLERRYPIHALGVFGSYARGEQREDSDLDVLVELGANAPMTLIDFVGLQMELSDSLGVKVDLADKAALKRRIGQNILSEVRML